MATAEHTIRCLDALGAFWRADWSDFDGRTLVVDLRTIAEILELEAKGEDVAELADEFVGDLKVSV